jgi:clan AA aspartic protease (TIGR02281 family)
MLALFLGLFIGWLAQQFWYIGRGSEYAMPGERDLVRYQQRLDMLRRQPYEQHPVASLSSALTQNASSNPEFSAEDFDAGVIWFQNNESADLTQIMKIAELGFASEHYEPVLLFLYDVRLQLDSADESALLKEITSLVERIDTRLTEAQQVQRLVDIYRLLISLQAENTYYYLRLSYWLIQAGESLQAKEALSGAKNDIRYAATYKELEELIVQTETGRLNYAVPLTRVGEHYLVGVTLNENLETRLMLDTGASNTVLKAEIAEQFLPGSEVEATVVQLSTANGKTEGLSVNLDQLRLGEVAFSDIELVVMELPDFQYDGLLGMNILNRFEFSIDQLNSQLVLRPKLRTNDQSL